MTTITAIAYVCGSLTTLTPDRLALYRWAEAHDWPRGVVISAWERIGGGSADRWQQACEQLSAAQVERATAAIAGVMAQEQPARAPLSVCIAGSRRFSRLDLVRAHVRTLPPGTLVVTGGAEGVDQTADEEARTCGLATLVMPVTPAEWDRYGKSAGPRRNAEMLTKADRVDIFYDGVSRGTADMGKRARAAGKLGKVVVVRAEKAEKGA